MKLIIFDVDGVLEKEDKIIAARFEAQAKAISKKLNISVEEAKEKHRQRRKELPSDRKHTSAYVFMNFGYTRNEYFEIINSVDPQGLIEPYENCKQMLEELEDKNILIAYSNTPAKASQRTLAVLGISKYLRKVYSVEDFEESKPSTKNLEIILKEQGFKPKDTVFVGNSIEKDVMPAEKIGIKAVLFDPHDKFVSEKGKYLIIKDLMEVRELV